MLRMVSLLLLLVVPVLVVPVPGVAQGVPAVVPGPPPTVREANLPRTRWEHQPQAALWTRSAIAALKAHGAGLVERVPGDIEEWCPAYAQSADKGRRAFWVGFLSALAKYESTYNAGAVGGGGQWHGLLQILPATARGYGCRAGDGAALRHGPDNLSCAIRIMAHTVRRDGVVSRGMRGVAADWGPLHSSAKREDMKRWLRAQSYCKPLYTVRPRARPAQITQVAQVAR
ncbi:hypothetical protein ACSSV4_002242 [Roseovarius sp. MBR-154]|jgi:hypothetical protein